ncbi:MAG TPA: glycosyltransferase [Nitrospirota bacterium]|nr:glycosyltransferase [Nitrospirota bacterium]
MKRLTFITEFYPNETSGLGPWCERYKGLYGKLFQDGDASFRTAWYSLADSCLREKKGDELITSSSTIVCFLMSELMRACFGKRQTTLVIAYPLLRTSAFVTSAVTVLLLRAMKATGMVRVVVDFIDPPLMMIDMFVGSGVKKRVMLFLRRIQEKALLRSAEHVITNAPEMGEYLQTQHQLDIQAFHVIPMGLNVAEVRPVARRPHHAGFAICYGGVLSVDRGARELFSCIEKVNAIRPVELLCCGRLDGTLDLPNRSWLKVLTGLTYREYMEILSNRADAGIIPYPVSDWWSRVSISKLATYAAAGIPILSTNLGHTRKFLTAWDCGLVAESWEEMEKQIVRLYDDRALCHRLGDNARKSAEQALDWRMLARELKMVLSRSALNRTEQET